MNSNNKNLNTINNNINEQETENEKLFNKVLEKKYNRENGELLTFRNLDLDPFEIKNSYIIGKNDNYYIVSIAKNNKKYLDFLDGVNIQYLELLTCKKPIPSLKNSIINEIKLSFDKRENVKYLKNLLYRIRKVKNLQILDIRHIYSSFFGEYNKNILYIIDNILTFFKKKHINLEYRLPNIYRNRSLDYKFINFTNKKEIFDSIAEPSSDILREYKNRIKDTNHTLNKYINIFSHYIEKIECKIQEKEKYISDIEKLEKETKYEEENIEDYKENKLSNEKELLIKLYREKENSHVYMDEFLENKNKLRIKNELIKQIEIYINNEKYNKMENIYYYTLQIMNEHIYFDQIDFIDYLGAKCNICLEDINIIQVKYYLYKTNCNHVFHEKCINSWLKKYKNKCPLCKKNNKKIKHIN